MGVVASMATIAGREESLTKAITSLLPQVDRLIVTLNGPAQCPVDDPKVEVRRNVHNLGDQEKLLALLDVEADWLFSCDDDLIYPPSYAKTMVAECGRLGGAVSAHGAQLTFPITSYYRSRRQYHCAGQTALTSVHVIGSGCACFSPSAVVWTGDDFPVANMADIWLAIALAKAKIPRYVVAHPSGWLKVADPHNQRTIWHASQRQDGSEMDTGQQQTSAIREHEHLFR